MSGARSVGDPAPWRWPEAGWLTQGQLAAIPAVETSCPGSLLRNPTVSVLMLTYNHAPFLEHAVSSVIKQRYDEALEILIGEDNSEDTTLELALKLQRQWPSMVRVISSDNNVGIRQNFLRLLIKARAPYIAFLEGDDYWVCPDKLHEQINLLRRNPTLSCVAGFTLNRPRSLPPSGQACFHLPDLLRRYPVHSSSLVFRKELALPYPAFPEGALDSMLLALLAQQGPCGLVPRPVSYYRRHDGGFWCGAKRLDRLRMSQACVDALDAYFSGCFRAELIDREFWIYALDWPLPAHQPWRHWRQSWHIIVSESSRLISRSPWRFLLLCLRTLLQPICFAAGWSRRRMALGSRVRMFMGLFPS